MTELLPALVVFSLGLSATVAPLTATVLSDADEEHAGIASGVNNAIARAGGLLGVAALGAVIAAQFSGALREHWRRRRRGRRPRAGRWGPISVPERSGSYPVARSVVAVRTTPGGYLPVVRCTAPRV